MLDGSRTVPDGAGWFQDGSWWCLKVPGGFVMVLEGSRMVPDGGWWFQDSPWTLSVSQWSWTQPDSLRQREHGQILVTSFLNWDSHWRMEKQGKRRKWGSRRAAQLGRARTGGGMADWREVGRKKKGGWGVNVRSEWRINPPPQTHTIWIKAVHLKEPH